MCGTCGCGENTAGITVTLIDHEVNKEALVGSPNGHMHHHHHHHGGHHHHHHDGHHQHHHDGHHHHHHDPIHSKVIEVEKDILLQNSLEAARNRGYFEAKHIVAINLVSSPGSGKTTLLENTLGTLKEHVDVSVIEGDQQTFNDANRIAALDVPVVQINTGKACHLDASMVHNAIHKLNPPNNSMLFIENVGNLVCPAMFDLGESRRVVIMSVTEGEDKAIKYPDMFLSSQLCIINKIDLLPYVDFDLEKAKDYALKVNHHLEFIELSATQGTGMDQWSAWLETIKQPA